jgi:hypothetical protein
VSGLAQPRDAEANIRASGVHAVALRVALPAPGRKTSPLTVNPDPARQQNSNMPEPETAALNLTCAEWGRSPRAGETWRILFADIGEAGCTAQSAPSASSVTRIGSKRPRFPAVALSQRPPAGRG